MMSDILVTKQGIVAAKLLAMFSYVLEDEALSLSGALPEEKKIAILNLLDKGIDEIRDGIINHVGSGSNCL